MKSYIAFFTGIFVSGVQHYLYYRALWGTFKPVAQVIDRRINRR